MQSIENIIEPILVGDARPCNLQDFAVVHVQPIAWGDMDAFNHVNNVAYYRYAESARISYMRALGLMHAREDLLTILVSSKMQYYKPVSYPDTLLIGVHTHYMGTTSLAQQYIMFSHAQKVIVAIGDAVIVRTNHKMKKSAWTDEERALIERFEDMKFPKISS